MSQTVTVSFVPDQILTWVIIGLIAGTLAGVLIRGYRFGFLGSVLVGLLGALLGGFLFSILHIQAPAALSGGVTLRWVDVLAAFVGAVIILLLFGGFYRSRRPLV
jgi:uncharacterized membrane protein YeaQ/YmgE (transglycosylase-associated protein family)